MAQFARPDSNITQTGMTGGFAEIDEATPSDSDLAWGADNTAALLEVTLSNVTDPGVHTGHIVRFRWAKTNDGVPDGGGNAVSGDVGLYDYSVSTSVAIAAKGLTALGGSFVQDSFTLTEVEAAGIADYTQLVLKFGTTQSGGNPTNRRGGAISWAELEVPDAGGATSNRVVIWIDGDA